MSTASSTSTTVRRRVAGAGLALGLVGVAVVGGSSWAGAAGSDATLYACAKSNGDLRLVAAGTACKNDERAVSWSSNSAQGSPAPSVIGYLAVPGVTGSGTGVFDGQVPVVAWSWGLTNSGSAHTGGGGGAGKVTFQQVGVTVAQDPSSVALIGLLVDGRVLDTVTLTLCGDASCSVPRRTVLTMQQVLVSSLSTGGSGTGPGADGLTLDVGRFAITRGDQSSGT